MFNEYGLNIYDFDIYSRRISFFYNKRDKVGTIFGLILTFLYVIITIILFFYYLIKIIKRTEVKSHESILFSQGLPSININPDLFYFAFGLEHPISLSRYIDESIYYPKVYFIKQEKKNGIFVTEEIIPLKVERCDVRKFGKEYQSQFTLGELNNSYCLTDFSLLLVGGSKYDHSSFIQIKAHPCVNKTENHNHCLPQNIIDFYLTSGYFSIVLKDIGFNPLNYSFPIIPIIQNLKTNIDKTMCRESLIYMGISEVKSDIGLFSNSIKTETFLQYRKYSQSFYFIEETDYHEGKEIFAAQIKLEEYIHVQNREYTKMAEVFSFIGGYMQLISNIFVLIRLITKNLSVEKKVINQLFNFNIKKRKLILDIKYDKKLNYLIHFENGDLNSFVPFEAKKSIIFDKNKRNLSNQRINGNLKINEISILKSNNSFVPLVKTNLSESININNYLKKRIKNNSEKKIDMQKIVELNKNNINEKKREQNHINRSKMEMPIKEEEINKCKIINLYDKKKLKKNKDNMSYDTKDIIFNENELISFIDFNILKLFCCIGKCKIPNINLELYNFGVNFYRNQMNIINIFNLLFLTEIILTHHTHKKNNIFNQLIEISLY